MAKPLKDWVISGQRVFPITPVIILTFSGSQLVLVGHIPYTSYDSEWLTKLSFQLDFRLAVAGKQPASFRTLAGADTAGTHWSCPPKSMEEDPQQGQARETSHLSVGHGAGTWAFLLTILRTDNSGLSRDYGMICPSSSSNKICCWVGHLVRPSHTS